MPSSKNGDVRLREAFIRKVLGRTLKPLFLLSGAFQPSKAAFPCLVVDRPGRKGVDVSLISPTSLFRMAHCKTPTLLLVSSSGIHSLATTAVVCCRLQALCFRRKTLCGHFVSSWPTPSRGVPGVPCAVSMRHVVNASHVSRVMQSTYSHNVKSRGAARFT